MAARVTRAEDLIVRIVGPGKSLVQHRVVDQQNDSFRIYFEPTQVGSYQFDVSVAADRQMFTAKGYDVSRILVTDVPKSCLVNEICSFGVDASQAGEGQLEIAVNDGDVPNQVSVNDLSDDV